MIRSRLTGGSYFNWNIVIFFGIAVICFSGALSLIIFFSRIFPVGISCASSVRWIGPAAGGNWETPENWSCGQVPGPDDDVMLSTSTDRYIQVTLSAGMTADFRTLTVGGEGGFATLYLAGNIGRGGDITVETFGTIEQQNSVTQHISGALVVKENATLTHSSNGREHRYSLNFSADTIDIQVGGYALANGKGYSGDGAGPGAGATAEVDGVLLSAGGAHGGNGGSRDSVNGGLAYCDVTNITTLGSAGGFSEESPFNGAGGGYISLRSRATTTLSGVLNADGAPGTLNARGEPVGGGAGGGIRIISGGAIVGNNPNITANGVSGFGELSAGGGGGCMELLYHTTSTILNLGPLISVNRGHHSAVAQFPEDGLFYAAQFNTVPTVAMGTPVQTSTTTVAFSVEVADLERDQANLVVEHSFDGLTWASSTLVSVTATEGVVATSTGRITGILTSATNTLAVVWNSGVDMPPGNIANARVRAVVNDGQENGATVLSYPFSIIMEPPTHLTVTTATDQAVSLTWWLENAFSDYEVTEETDTFSSGWIAGNTHVFSSLSCGTRYVFYVKGKNAAGIETDYSAAVPITTLPCPTATDAAARSFSVGPGSSGASPVAPAPGSPAPVDASPLPSSPAVPEIGGSVPERHSVTEPFFLNALPETVVRVDLDSEALATLDQQALLKKRQDVQVILDYQSQIEKVIAESTQTIVPQRGNDVPITLGYETHTLNVSSATPAQATLILHSHLVRLTLKVNERREVDTDDDGANDIIVEYKGLIKDEPVFAVSLLTDPGEDFNPFTINGGALQTDSRQVVLTFNVPEVRLIELSSTPDFTSSTIFGAVSSTRWMLPEAVGPTWVFVRFHKFDRSVLETKDSIFVQPSAVPTWSLLLKKNSTPALVFTRNLQLGSAGNEVRLLQSILKTKNFFPSTQAITGYYGALTRKGVIMLQNKFSLPPIGQVGPATRALLNTLAAER